MPLPSHLISSAPTGAVTATAPGAAVDGASESGRILIRPNVPFIYAFYPRDPGSWHPMEIVAGKGVRKDEVGVWWLLKPTKVYVRPGSSGFTSPKTGEPPTRARSLAYEKIRERGGIVLDESEGFCVGYPCIDPVTRREGTYFVEAWARSGEKIQGRPLKFRGDTQVYRRFLLALIRDGKIPTITKAVKSYRLRGYDEAVARRVTTAARQLPEDSTVAESYVDEVAGRKTLAAAAKTVGDDPKPTPKPVSKTPAPSES